MSTKISLAILFLCAIFAPVRYARPDGLGFVGNDRPIDLRTSYDVLGGQEAVAERRFAVSFDLSMRRSSDLGYILRVKDAAAGRIFNLFFDGQGSDLVFRFNEEGTSTLAAFDIPRDEWPDGEWRRVAVAFDVERDRISVEMAGRTVDAADVGLPARFVPEVVFGRSEYIIDVPRFAINDLAVECDSRETTFALDEYDGGEVHDGRGRAVGMVANPLWLIRESCEWQLLGEFSSRTVAGALYDPDAGAVHYLNGEEITTLDVRTGRQTVRRFTGPCPVRMTQGTCFMAAGRIYVYEVFNGGRTGTVPTVASCDLQTLTWRVEGTGTLPTQLHHHSSWLDPAAGRYTIFGGFGDMHYSRDFHTLDLASGRWVSLPQPRGETIEPRYFSSMGRSEEGAVLLFGGMGNTTGEQTVGRRYFYDLHRVDPVAGTRERLWSIPWEGDDMVPTRGMTVADGYFYTLLYPEYLTDSQLTLYRFSVADGSHECMEARIPIGSDKITTNANLYHDRALGRLYALVQEFDDDISSDLKVYSLAFPPVMAARPTACRTDDGERRTNVAVIVALAALVAAAAAVAWRFFRLRTAARTASARETSSAAPATRRDGVEKGAAARPNSVWLFGDFTVTDSRSRDISYMFSALLRRMFCLILEHSAGGGISSRSLSASLWPDKPEDRVKNSRGVAIHGLRKVLGEMSGVELVHEQGKFRIVADERFRCDAMCVEEIIGAGVTDANRAELLEMVGRGKFLKFGGGNPLYDSYKKRMEQVLEPVLSKELRRSFEAGEFRTTIDVAEALFHIDPFDDKAMRLSYEAMNRLKMKDAALVRLKMFAAEYKRATGRDFE